MDDEQKAELGRVRERIGQAIMEWWGGRISSGSLEFHAEEMRSHVNSRVGHVAPGSPDRIMRALRGEGFISYRVLSRSKSLYAIVPASRQMEMF